jgi:hypothetical protein
MSSHGVFPFGQSSTERPPRRPSGDNALLFVLGVYPSAFHIRWTLPEWARSRFGWEREHVGALAVDVEPEVFWDGRNDDDLLEEWRKKVDWREGDDDGCFGRCAPAMNGTSGRAVADHVLDPLGVDSSRVWFSDCIPWFFVKSSTSRPQQAEVITTVYAPFASELGLQAASLPARPSRGRLVTETVSTQRERLLSEVADSKAEIVVTLGEEPRRVMCRLADDCSGSPIVPLQPGEGYGHPGTLTFGGRQLIWYSLSHPGNRSPRWEAARSGWMSRVQRIDG